MLAAECGLSCCWVLLEAISIGCCCVFRVVRKVAGAPGQGPWVVVVAGVHLTDRNQGCLLPSAEGVSLVVKFRLMVVQCCGTYIFAV